MTLYWETPCEHGYTRRHLNTGNYGDRFDKRCPGGPREEVTIDYEAAAGLLSTLDDIPSLAHPEEVLPFATRVVDAALHTKKETASTVRVQP